MRRGGRKRSVGFWRSGAAKCKPRHFGLGEICRGGIHLDLDGAYLGIFIPPDHLSSLLRLFFSFPPRIHLCSSPCFFFSFNPYIIHSFVRLGHP